LAVDSSAAGSDLECPACHESITVPAADPANVVQMPTTPPAPIALGHGASDNKHYSVPATAHSDVLIQKGHKTLEIAAKETDKKIRVKTIRRVDCQEVGKDKFDEIVTEFVQRVGQPNIVSISPIGYSYVDMASRNLMQDYGLVIVFRG